MKTVTFKRPKEGSNKHQPYKIVAGNTPLAWLSNGEEKSIQIPKEMEGKPLRAEMLWYGSKSINLAGDFEHKEVTVSGHRFLNNSSFGLSALVLVACLFVFNMTNWVSQNVGIGIMAVLLLAVLVKYSLFRHKWLKLEIQQKEEPSVAATTTQIHRYEK